MCFFFNKLPIYDLKLWVSDNLKLNLLKKNAKFMNPRKWQVSYINLFDFSTHSLTFGYAKCLFFSISDTWQENISVMNHKDVYQNSKKFTLHSYWITRQSIYSFPQITHLSVLKCRVNIFNDYTFKSEFSKCIDFKWILYMVNYDNCFENYIWNHLSFLVVTRLLFIFLFHLSLLCFEKYKGISFILFLFFHLDHFLNKKTMMWQWHTKIFIFIYFFIKIF